MEHILVSFVQRVFQSRVQGEPATSTHSDWKLRREVEFCVSRKCHARRRKLRKVGIGSLPDEIECRAEPCARRPGIHRDNASGMGWAANQRVADGVDGMNFITRSVASSAEKGAWMPLKHPLCR